MKAKKILLGAGCVLAVAALASCGEKTASVDEVIAGFDTTLSNQSVKGTFKNNYQVTVDAHGGTSDFSSFRHDIESTLDFEFTLGDNFYFYSKKTWEDKNETNSKEVKEAILYQDNGKYYYSSTYTTAVEVTTSVKEKLESILTSVSSEQAGSLNLGSFIYTKKQYEYDYFGLTTTFELEELVDSTYEVTEDNGLTVTYKPTYVGYQTDNGMSDFGAADGKDSAAVVTINVDNKGQVTGWTETYQASLDFAIMTPKPTVSINGSRSLSVSYNQTLTEKKDSDITHKNPVSKVILANSENGTYTVSYFDYAKKDYTMHTVNSYDRVEVGMYLAIKPTASEGYEVNKVTVNGEETAVVVNGMYCFEVTAETQKVSVTFKEGGAEEPTTPELLGTYEGTIGNVVVDVNIYKDNTFSVTCPGYNGAKAGDGTYTKDGSTLTLTSTNMQYFTVTNTTITLTMSSDYQTLTTNCFFDGSALTLTLKA